MCLFPGTNTPETAQRIIISDNSVGIREDENDNRKQSMGMQIVYALVDQLDGVITGRTVGGTSWEIQLPSNEAS